MTKISMFANIAELNATVGCRSIIVTLVIFGHNLILYRLSFIGDVMVLHGILLTGHSRYVVSIC
jgi:hypothetical protein